MGNIILSASEVPADLVEFFEPIRQEKADVFNVATQPYPQAHYATFPTKLVEPMILASTSQQGCCPKCGAQWVRVVEKIASRSRLEGNDWQNGRAGVNHHGPSRPGSFTDGESKTTGWRPSCTCLDKAIHQEWLNRGCETLQEKIAIEAELKPKFDPIPAVILDPFCGSATVGEVCRGLGRRFIGLDLSATYLALNALPRSERGTSQKSLESLPMFQTSF
jgi:hypothetical protein